MRALTRLAARLTHDCGASFEVPFEQIERPYTCPGCGRSESIDPVTMPGLMADFGRALLEVHRQHSATGDDVRLRLDRHTGSFIGGEQARG